MFCLIAFCPSCPSTFSHSRTKNNPLIGYMRKVTVLREDSILQKPENSDMEMSKNNEVRGIRGHGKNTFSSSNRLQKFTEYLNTGYCGQLRKLFRTQQTSTCFIQGMQIISGCLADYDPFTNTERTSEILNKPYGLRDLFSFCIDIHN